MRAPDSPCGRSPTIASSPTCSRCRAKSARKSCAPCWACCRRDVPRCSSGWRRRALRCLRPLPQGAGAVAVNPARRPRRDRFVPAGAGGRRRVRARAGRHLPRRTAAFEAERNAAAFARASSACAQAERMDPRLREVSLAMGEMHRTSGDLSEATKRLHAGAGRHLAAARCLHRPGRVESARDATTRDGLHRTRAPAAPGRRAHPARTWLPALPQGNCRRRSTPTASPPRWNPTTRTPGAAWADLIWPTATCRPPPPPSCARFRSNPATAR